MGIIKYTYGPAQETLAQTKVVITNMENTVSEVLTNCTQFFEGMDSNAKHAMQSKFNAVLKTGHNLLQACVAVNGATSEAVEAMQVTDTGLVPSFD